MFANPVTAKIAGFLTAIGIEMVPTQLDDGCFLPGIVVQRGKLLVDEAKLTFPGDLLHEAGHLAVVSSDIRPTLSGEVTVPDANMEMMEVLATAWAYAAIVHLGLDPNVLFHDGGYRGKSEGLIFTFSLGVYPGSYGLQCAGMTATGDLARQLKVEPYPHMLKWLQD